MNELELIAEQDATITQLRADLAVANGKPVYFEAVYDNIRAAWDAWALTELGTSSPSHGDLQGRPELAALWEAVR